MTEEGPDRDPTYPGPDTVGSEDDSPGGAIRHHPSALVLAAQLVAILAYPFLETSVAGRAILGVLQMAIVLTAVFAVRRTPTLTWVGLLLAPPAMVFTVMEAIWQDTGWIVLGSAVLHAPFYFYVSYAMLRYLFHDDRVTRDELFATAAAFTVVAWGFAYIYSGLQVVVPGSFTGFGEGERTWFELLYVSFAQLTSVGLSDVTPVMPHARSVAILEQVAGVFYIALVVARMVGLTVIGKRV
jgi:hypothetical protein